MRLKWLFIMVLFVGGHGLFLDQAQAVSTRAIFTDGASPLAKTKVIISRQQVVGGPITKEEQETDEVGALVITNSQDVVGIDIRSGFFVYEFDFYPDTCPECIAKLNSNSFSLDLDEADFDYPRFGSPLFSHIWGNPRTHQENGYEDDDDYAWQSQNPRQPIGENIGVGVGYTGGTWDVGFMRDFQIARDFDLNGVLLGTASQSESMNEKQLTMDFAPEFEMHMAYFELFAALPKVSGSVGTFYTALNVKVGAGEAQLEINQSAGSNNRQKFSGTVPYIEGGISSLYQFKKSPFFIGADYSYKIIPSTSLDDQSPAPSGNVIGEEHTISYNSHELRGRLGYNICYCLAVYLGLGGGWGWLDIDSQVTTDETFFTQVTTTNREFEAEPIFGLAGADFRVNDRLFGRVETEVGDGDWGVEFKVTTMIF